MADSATKYPERVDAVLTLRSEARIGRRTKDKLFFVGHPLAYNASFTNYGTKEIPGYKAPPWQLFVHVDWGDGSMQLIPHNIGDKLPPGKTIRVQGSALVRAPGVFSIRVGYPFHKRWEDKEKKQQSLQHGEETVSVGTWVAIDESTYIQRRNLRVTIVGIVVTIAVTLVAVFLFR